MHSSLVHISACLPACLPACQEGLRARSAVSSRVALSDPRGRARDGLTGEAVAMRVREGESGSGGEELVVRGWSDEMRENIGSRLYGSRVTVGGKSVFMVFSFLSHVH